MIRFYTLCALTLLLSAGAPTWAQTAKQSSVPSVEFKPEASATAVPTNDDFANATPITDPGILTGTNVGATSEPGEPRVPAACASSETGLSIWYTFVSGDGSPVTFDTDGSLATSPPASPGAFLDTIVSVHAGSSLATLTQIACNDDDPTNTTPGDFTSRVTTPALTAGTRYYVRISSFNGGAGTTVDRSTGSVRLQAIGNFSLPSGPSLVAGPSPLAFGATEIGATPARTITITNNGTTDITISAITYAGSADFTATGTTPGVLAPGATQEVTITYAPTSAGTDAGTLTITSNAPTSPIVIDIMGFANATSTIPPGTTVGGPTWARPNTVGTGASGSCTVATTTSGSATAYATQPMTVTAAGAYTVTTNYAGNSPAFDGYLFLYRAPFNPADPCLNLVGLNDDFSIDGAPATQGSRIANAALTVGDYVVVVTGFRNTAAGTYTGTVVGPAAVTFGTVSGEGTPEAARAALSASPNPVRSAATVRLSVEQAQDVSVSVYDALGRQVATLFDGAAAAGQTLELRLDAAGLPAGVYVVRAHGASVDLTQRVTVVR